MTKTEVSALLRAIKQFYPRDSEADITQRTAMWHQILEPFPYEAGKSAVLAYSANDKSGFPPSVGQLLEEIRRMCQPGRDSDELAAWEIVSAAARRSSMSPSSRHIGDTRTSAEREYEKLPPDIQEIVHSPSQLAAWGQLEDGVLNTVIQSQFLKAYRAKREADIHAQKASATLGGMLNGCDVKMALEAAEPLTPEEQTQRAEGFKKIIARINPPRDGELLNYEESRKKAEEIKEQLRKFIDSMGGDADQ